MRNPFDVVGYTYAADLLCKGCAQRLARRSNPDAAPIESWLAETELNDWARQIGLDRDDETTFDSDDFPKVVFADQCIDGREVCGECGDGLL